MPINREFILGKLKIDWYTAVLQLFECNIISKHKT